MRIQAYSAEPTAIPSAIIFVQRRARVSQAHAKLIAELHGLPTDDWQAVAPAPARQLSRNSGRRA